MIKPLQARFVIVSTLLLRFPSTTKGQDCPKLNSSSDLGNTTASSTVGLLADILAAVDGGANPSVQILEFNTVCLSQGILQDTYTSTSVVVRYRGGDGNESTVQVEYECSAGMWDLSNQLAIDTMPIANLTTPVKTTCALCRHSPQTAPGTEHCTGTFIIIIIK